MTSLQKPSSAKADIDDILGYYLENADQPVAENFLTALSDAIRHIRNHPATGSSRTGRLIRQPTLRIWPVKGFPHLVFYTYENGEVDILRVLHTSRDIPATLRE